MQKQEQLPFFRLAPLIDYRWGHFSLLTSTHGDQKLRYIPNPTSPRFTDTVCCPALSHDRFTHDKSDEQNDSDIHGKEVCGAYTPKTKAPPVVVEYE